MALYPASTSRLPYHSGQSVTLIEYKSSRHATHDLLSLFLLTLVLWLLLFQKNGDKEAHILTPSVLC